MNRRDTIIVAVLVNAGLLMVLFATATKSKISLESQIVQEIPVKETKKVAKSVPATTLDELLFASEEPLVAEVPLEEESLLVEEPIDYVTITVKQGDALERIARANNTSIAKLVELNQLASTKLALGQRLKVPVSEESLQESIPEEFYIVKDGDNPWLIASKSKVKLEELLRLNNLNEATAKKLRPGDRLRIR